MSDSDNASGISFLDHPEIEQLFASIFSDLVSESDRGAVLIGTSHVDFHLRRLFETVAPKSMSRRKLLRILEYPGPLSSLSAKANIAYLTRLIPDEDDYFVLKPKHSAFYKTNLDVLLKYLGTRTLLLTGLAGDNCVLFSANDAYMRDFKIIVPSDCTVSIKEEDNRYALQQMQQVLKADISPSRSVDFGMLTLHGAHA